VAVEHVDDRAPAVLPDFLFQRDPSRRIDDGAPDAGELR
jgi:hypothetical protein